MSVVPGFGLRRCAALPRRFRALCFIACAACYSTETLPRTEVLLQVDADEEVRARAQRLTIELRSGAANAATLSDVDPEVFDLKAPSFHWPASLALVAKPTHEDHVFEATLLVEANDMPLARARVRSAFLKDKTLLLTTSLFGACIDKFDCSDDQTCVAEAGAAKCVTAQVDAALLPAFVPGANAGAGGGAAGSGEVDAGHALEAGSSGAPMRDAGGPNHPDKDAAAAALDASTTTSPDAAQLRPDAGQAGEAGGGGAGGGAAPSCTPSTEQCWNGLDDDCNGMTDCADPACAVPAVCAPASALSGVMVAATDSCPTGFAGGETLLYQGLNDPGCSGCSCTAGTTQCTGRVYYYATTSACSADVAPYSGGTLLTPVPSYTCGAAPIGDSQSMDTPVAWRVTMTASPDTCTPSGSAQPLPPTWSTRMKLCAASSTGGGCQQGFSCVPRVIGAKTCGEKSQSGICPTSAAAETWQRSYSDNRSCGNCGCSASGGSCSNVQVQLGHDWGCGTIDGSLYGGQKSCSISTYSPPAILSGLPLNPTCTSSAAENGSVLAAAPIDLCCTTSGTAVVDTL
jgi:hypothetical protein